MPYLLDTNVVIALFAGEPLVLNEVRNAEETSQLCISVIVLGELYYGARKSAKPVENAQRVDTLETRAIVVGCDSSTSRAYGSIRDSLRMKGMPIQTMTFGSRRWPLSMI